jgi:hypothetical protein
LGKQCCGITRDMLHRIVTTLPHLFAEHRPPRTLPGIGAMSAYPICRCPYSRSDSAATATPACSEW